MSSFRMIPDFKGSVFGSPLQFCFYNYKYPAFLQLSKQYSCFLSRFKFFFGSNSLNLNLRNAKREKGQQTHLQLRHPTQSRNINLQLTDCLTERTEVQISAGWILFFNHSIQHSLIDLRSIDLNLGMIIIACC